MKTTETAALYNRNRSVEYYENRFSRGYVERETSEKKQKIIEIIQNINLPAKGEALDFGCGNGILTETLRQALPGWTIYGTDLSRTAIGNAELQFPDCKFFHVDDDNFKHKKFDLIFTHHVFEHVYNLEETFNQIESYLKESSSMLHILPCGNKGSFEHKLSSLRKDGINKELENRFFFEDICHVRRLNTEQFSELSEAKGFSLQKEYYGNQYYGAIEWITANVNPGFLLGLTSTAPAIDKPARQRLLMLRTFILTTAFLRGPVNIINKVRKQRTKKIWHYLLLLSALPFFIFSKPVDAYWKSRAEKEWKTDKSKCNGSEMFLFFSREPGI